VEPLEGGTALGSVARTKTRTYQEVAITLSGNVGKLDEYPLESIKLSCCAVIGFFPFIKYAPY